MAVQMVLIQLAVPKDFGKETLSAETTVYLRVCVTVSLLDYELVVLTVVLTELCLVAY